MADDRAELHALIVENMAHLEDSYREFDAVSKATFSAMDAIARDWARENGWVGVFDYLTNNLSLAAASWATPGDAETPTAKAWFTLGAGDDDLGAQETWDLSRLCHVRSDVLGFQVWPDWKSVGVKGAAWKRAARSRADDLQAVGFHVGSKGTVFRQVRLDASGLAQAFRNQSLEDALEPWRAALEALKPAVPLIEEILAAATDGAAQR